MVEKMKGTALNQPTVRLFLISSIAFFLITVLIGLIIATKFIWPEFMSNMAFMSYGRMRPLHINGVLFGWLLSANMGLVFWLVPRICGNKLWSEKLGVATGILWNATILGAVYTTLAGHTQGLEYAELPLALDIAVTVAWLMFGTNVFATIATRKHEKMYVSLWYIMGSVIWTSFVWITGNFAVMFFSGVNQANLNWFFVHNAVGLIFTPLGVAIAYYFIPISANKPLYSHKLSMIGFWSIAFIYVWTGAHHMIHGPISQWLQTVSILFSAMLIIPVWTVIVNFFGTVQGRWDVVRKDAGLKFLMAGTTFYVLTCFQGPMQSFRTVNAITSKTDWVVGHAHMAVFGAFSFFAVAGCLYAIPRLVNRKLHSDSLANHSFWLMLLGGLLYFVSLWVGGFMQGLQWNDPSIPFVDTVVFMQPFWVARVVAGFLIVAGVGLFFYNIIRTLTAGDPTATAVPATEQPVASES